MKKVQDELFTGLESKRLEIDEIWGFVGAKALTTKTREIEGACDDWTWIALDADTKLVPSWHVSDRKQVDADALISDLKSKLVNRPQISTDGLSNYIWAIEKAFGSDVDYGSIVKTYSQRDLKGARRYSLPEVVSTKKEVMQGNPDVDKAAISLHYGYYNLVKSHKTIKCTPAMEAGKTKTFWTVRDLVEKGESALKFS